ncbi:hypothetical protein AAG570_013764 [Ranatra chinensis]|uniref:Mos1 transposase HTH domain-containing protein n=1 Tax=Ranatra chinensis TaxID=642074 RepID=A0ABD0YD55_9HEMI
MDSSLEQRYAIKFCSNVNKSLGDTHKMLVEAYRESALSCSQVSRWFKEGREEVVDEPRSGRLSTSLTGENLNHVRDLLNYDSLLSVRLIADALNIPKTIVHELVNEKMNMRKVCAKLGARVLTKKFDGLLWLPNFSNASK